MGAHPRKEKEGQAGERRKGFKATSPVHAYKATRHDSSEILNLRCVLPATSRVSGCVVAVS